MKNTSIAYRNHKAQETTTVCEIWRITRTDGNIYGYTNFVKDLTYLGITFYSVVGFNSSAIKTTISLSVDNLELKIPLGNVITSISDNDLTSIKMFTDADIQAGIWDHAKIEIMEVNYEDLSMGHEFLKSGNIGQMTTGRNTVTVELRGMQQPLNQQVGRPYTSQCLADLGGPKCRVNIATYTFTGSVTKLVNQHGWIDTSLNQTNSTYVRNITDATITNPVVITCPGHGMQSGERVTFTGISGMTELNGLTSNIAYIDANRFSLSIDGTTFTAYAGGGTVTKTVVSEYFKDGYLIWTSGNNIGIKCDIKTYRPNAVTLYDALIFHVQIGDTYTIVAGCDKLMPTCHNRFSNTINFYGFNLVPGQDKALSGA